MKVVENMSCFQLEVKSFVMDEDGQGRSYRYHFLYSADPKGAWEFVEEKISDELNDEPGRDSPCKIHVLAYVDGNPKEKDIRVKDWEGVRKVYEKWFENLLP